jgi:hypothetical protein
MFKGFNIYKSHIVNFVKKSLTFFLFIIQHKVIIQESYKVIVMEGPYPAHYLRAFLILYQNYVFITSIMQNFFRNHPGYSDNFRLSIILV